MSYDYPKGEVDMCYKLLGNGFFNKIYDYVVIEYILVWVTVHDVGSTVLLYIMRCQYHGIVNMFTMPYGRGTSILWITYTGIQNAHCMG